MGLEMKGLVCTSNYGLPLNYFPSPPPQYFAQVKLTLAGFVFIFTRLGACNPNNRRPGGAEKRTAIKVWEALWVFRGVNATNFSLQVKISEN